MKLLFDMFPIILFFVAYKWGGMYVATAVAIAATFGQVGFFWLRHHRVEKMHIVTLAIIVVFGGATLLLRDPMFIKWKPTVLDWAFAVAFIGSRMVSGKTLAEHMMGHAVSLPSAIWGRLNAAWSVFFIGMGILNLVVAYHYSDDIWVDFKLFGTLGLTLVFVFLQALYLGRHMEPEQKPEEGG
ncbi:MAG: septation protein A [Chromatiales bacterium 21-64-14]|nr:MAG: septation protein A [Chromatiales bacterium 21-64-14]HQU15355.1 septation protein A [Gammaproteobacteria bacterium]